MDRTNKHFELRSYNLVLPTSYNVYNFYIPSILIQLAPNYDNNSPYRITCKKENKKAHITCVGTHIQR